MSGSSLHTTGYLDSLNPAQRTAAVYGGCDGDEVFRAGPLLIIAGAGTGKTNTLAHRVAHLVLNRVPPERILLLTFTRRAAEEMTRRAQTIVTQATKEANDSRDLPRFDRNRLVWSGTFHAVANRLLRRFARNLGLDPGFSVMDRGDSADLMDLARHELGFSTKNRRFPKKDTCLSIYSRCVNTRGTLEDCLESVFPWCADWEKELKTLFSRYVDIKQRDQALDYDDLLLYWYYLVQEEALAEALGAEFDHVLVDEYQDTNVLQAEILKAVKPDGAGVTVVGDDAQSIYSFRAADVENILSFPDRYRPRAQVLTLERNYRSTQSILDAANAVIGMGKRQYQKKLYSELKSEQRPRYVTVDDQDNQTSYIVERILRNRENGMRLRDQAVLFRSSHHSDNLELELLRRNIPYVKYGGLKFLEAAHVKDMLAVLRWADNPRNRVSAFRTLQLLPGMGPVNADRCFSHLENHDFRFESLQEFDSPAAARSEWPDLAALMMRLVGVNDAWHGQPAQVRRWYTPHLERIYDSVPAREGDLDQLEHVAERYPTRERFLTELTLDPPLATGDLANNPMLDEDYLILSTVHSSKGQEWEAVFIINVADGNFPSEFSTGSQELIEEERRLLYVAMTRAKSDLHLSAPLRYYAPQQHRHGDKHVYGARSRFLPDAVLERFERVYFSDDPGPAPNRIPVDTVKIDIAEKLRQMW